MKIKKNNVAEIDQHEHIWRRLYELSNSIEKLIRIIKQEEALSECGKRMLEELGRDVY